MISQRNKLLNKLKEEGRVNSYFATYQMKIKQAPTRIYELRAMGYNITRLPKSDGSVDWELEAKARVEVNWAFTKDGRAIIKETKQLSI
jgi:hypothetical protein